jgi:hypothetical protein
LVVAWQGLPCFLRPRGTTNNLRVAQILKALVGGAKDALERLSQKGVLEAIAKLTLSRGALFEP